MDEAGIESLANVRMDRIVYLPENTRVRVLEERRRTSDSEKVYRVKNLDGPTAGQEVWVYASSLISDTDMN